MSLLMLIIWIVVLGLVAWLITLVPIPPTFKQILNVILIIAAVGLVIFFLFNMGDSGGIRVR